MTKRKDIQDCGIQFGERWRLVPMDANNWELAHLHVTPPTHTARKAGTDGEVRWHRIGKFYQWSTIGSALRYAADFEMREHNTGEVTAILAALEEHERILRDFTDRLSRILSQA